MKKTFALVKTCISNSFSYRGDVFLFTLGNFVQPLVFLLVWLAVISSGGSAPLSRTEFIQYYLLVIIVHLWSSAWAAPFISHDIRMGKISPFLIKPAPYLIFQIGNNIGEKILKSFFAVPLVLFLGAMFGLNFPTLSIWEWLVFLMSWVIAAAIIFLFDIIIGISAFWIEDSRSLDEFYDVLLYFFSGRLIPLIALPLLLQHVANFLPFRYTMSFPIEIILRKLTNSQLIVGLFAQLFWLAIIVFIYKKLWKLGLKKYSASGA